MKSQPAAARKTFSWWSMVQVGIAARISGYPAICWLLSPPLYAPELNPVEHLWDDLREKSFRNRVLDSIDSLEAHLEQALADFEKPPKRTRGITGWPWIS